MQRVAMLAPAAPPTSRCTIRCIATMKSFGAGREPDGLLAGGPRQGGRATLPPADAPGTYHRLVEATRLPSWAITSSGGRTPHHQPRLRAT